MMNVETLVRLVLKEMIVITNDVFHKDDPHQRQWQGFKLPEGWWSRHYEYPWAEQFVGQGETVVDMGYGYTHRPFKNFLARRSRVVYGIDSRPSHEPILPEKFIPLVEDFTEQTSLAESSMDKVFCISVLEDLSNIPGGLREFRRVLKPRGLIILTFDIRFDTTQPTVDYHGVEIEDFWPMVEDAGLREVGQRAVNRKNAVVHSGYNLCCYHAVLEAV